MIQAFEFWDEFNVTQWNLEMEEIYIPLYQSYFGLDLNESQFIALQVINFMSQIADISNPEDYYYDIDELMSYLLKYNISSFNALDELFGSNYIINYTNILFNTFNINDINDINYLFYLENDQIFYKNLTKLINTTPPYIIQYWLFTDVLYHYFDINYENAFQQPRNENRRQFCYDLTRTSFTFLYAHIFISRYYSLNAQDMVQQLVDDIIDQGLLSLHFFYLLLFAQKKRVVLLT